MQHPVDDSGQAEQQCSQRDGKVRAEQTIQIVEDSGQAEQQCSQINDDMQHLVDDRGQAEQQCSQRNEKGRAEQTIQIIDVDDSGQAEQKCSQRDGNGRAVDDSGQAEQQCSQRDVTGQADQQCSLQKDQAEHEPLRPGGPSHYSSEGAPLYQINTRASGHISQTDDMQKQNEDPYTKAWKDWVERDRKRGLENAKRLEKQEKLSRSWELVRVCREMIKENYSSWQERKITEEEKRKILDLEQEKLTRLETGRKRQEKFKTSQDIESKEEAMFKRLILAEIKENAWKRREENKSSHEEYSGRQEKEEKILKRNKVQEKIKQLEEERKSTEEREKERKTNFMEEWRKKIERKKKQETIQQGWKDLLESVEQWEEIKEGETDFTDANLEEWFTEEWTEKGFREAGNVLEDVLSEVMAFLEMHGTVQTNNYNKEKFDKAETALSSESEFKETPDLLKTSANSRTVPQEKEIKKKRLSSGTVPADRIGELEKIRKHIELIESQIEKLRKV